MLVWSYLHQIAAAVKICLKVGKNAWFICRWHQNVDARSNFLSFRDHSTQVVNIDTIVCGHSCVLERCDLVLIWWKRELCRIRSIQAHHHRQVERLRVIDVHATYDLCSN